MKSWQTLVEAYETEDKILREVVTSCPRCMRGKPGADDALSCQAVLAHLAFWDGFTVDFFRRKLDPTSYPAKPPMNFEDRDREALESWAALPFGEVLARYLEAAVNLRDFLAEFWDRLSPREKHEFCIPLQHHRDHRMALELSLADIGADDQLDSMANGA